MKKSSKYHEFFNLEFSPQNCGENSWLDPCYSDDAEVEITFINSKQDSRTANIVVSNYDDTEELDECLCGSLPSLDLIGNSYVDAADDKRQKTSHCSSQLPHDFLNKNYDNDVDVNEEGISHNSHEQNLFNSGALPSKKNACAQKAAYSPSQYEAATYIKQQVPMLCIDGQLYVYESPCFVRKAQNELIAVYKRTFKNQYPQIVRNQSISFWRNVNEQLKTEEDLFYDLSKRKYKQAEIVFKNGVFDVIQGTMRDATPQDCFLFSNDVDFDPYNISSGVTSKQFLYDITNGDKEIERLIFTMLGTTLCQHVLFKRFWLLLGERNSGKSVLIKLVEKIVGEPLCSHVSLHQLTTQFAAGELHGKRLNTSADLSATPLTNLGILKMLTSGLDSMHVEKKYGEFRNINVAAQPITLIFAANRMPTISDKEDTDSFFTRLALIPFQFSKPESERNPNLLQQLWSERSFWIKNALDAYREFFENCYILPHSTVVEELLQNIREQDLDSVDLFVQRQCMRDDLAMEDNSALYGAYVDFCLSEHCYCLNEQAFIKSLRKRYSLQGGRHRVSGTNSKSYHTRGIRLIQQI